MSTKKEISFSQNFSFVYEIQYHKVYTLISLNYNGSTILHNWVKICEFVEIISCFCQGILSKNADYTIDIAIIFRRVSKDQIPYLSINIDENILYFDKVQCRSFLCIANRVLMRCNLLHESSNKSSEGIYHA